jgi:hypothetical protein
LISENAIGILLTFVRTFLAFIVVVMKNFSIERNADLSLDHTHKPMVIMIFEIKIVLQTHSFMSVALVKVRNRKQS